ncbi:hypothetical protein XENOCAPTIV_008126, partial [Xenoophorus captivus]
VANVAQVQPDHFNHRDKDQPGYEQSLVVPRKIVVLYCVLNEPDPSSCSLVKSLSAVLLFVKAEPPMQQVLRMGHGFNSLAFKPQSSLMRLGCKCKVWPQGVITARPLGRAGGSSGTPLAPLPLSGTSYRNPETLTGC